MSGEGVDRRPARTTAVVAVLAAAVVVTAVGWAVGRGRLAGIAVFGSLLLAVAAWGLDETSHARQAGGSIAATVGGAVFAGLCVLAVGGPHGVILVALSTGLSLVAVNAAVGFEWERTREITTALSENVKAALVGVAVSALCYVVVAFGVVPAVFGGALTFATSTPLLGFVTVQVLALSIALVIPKAVSVLEEWTPADGSPTGVMLGSVEAAGLRFEDVPRGYWYALGFQFVLAVVPQANQLFGLFVGGVPALVLTSGVLHALLGVVFLALLAVLVGEVVRWWVIAWFGAVPARTVATQAGAITAMLVAGLAGLLVELLPDSYVVDLVVPLAVSRYGFIGFPALVLVALVLAIVVVVLLLEIGPAIAGLGFAPERATGFALGSGLLFVATLSAAPAGAPAVVVFAGVAGSLLVWDLGSHATSVGLQLGQAAETRRSEFVHLTGSVLVLAGAVAVASVASYVVVPATAPAGARGTPGLATLSLILVLAALLAFVTAVHLRGEPSEG